MKYVIVCLAMLCCFAFAGHGQPTASAAAPAEVTEPAIVDDASPAYEVCGTTVCGKGMYCCNASCNMCAPVGGGCPDVVCGI